MSRFATGTIAGVALVDANGRACRADVLDAEALKSVIVAASVTALDNTVHTFISERLAAGVRYGVRVAQLRISKIEAIVAACESAMMAGNSFVVALADAEGVDDFDVQSVLEYQGGGKPYTRGTFSGVYVKDVVFRFIAIQPTEDSDE